MGRGAWPGFFPDAYPHPGCNTHPCPEKDKGLQRFLAVREPSKTPACRDPEPLQGLQSHPNQKDRSKSTSRLGVSEYDLIPQTRRAAMRLNQKIVTAAAPVAEGEPRSWGRKAP